MRDNVHKWIGAEGEANPDYSATDRRRGFNGAIQPSSSGKETPERVREVEEGVKEELKEGEKERGKFETPEGVKFGKELREKYWNFEAGWTNLNHGASFPFLSLSGHFSPLELLSSVDPELPPFFPLASHRIQAPTAPPPLPSSPPSKPSNPPPPELPTNSSN